VRLGIARVCEKKLSLIGGISSHDGNSRVLLLRTIQSSDLWNSVNYRSLNGDSLVKYVTQSKHRYHNGKT
jgi:hypothetical protein